MLESSSCNLETKSHATRYSRLHNINLHKLNSECGYATDGRDRRVCDIETPDLELFACSQCSYETSKETCLKKHRLSHSTSKFKCYQCNYETDRRMRLKTHMLSHDTLEEGNSDDESLSQSSGVKQFKCSECDFQTIYNSNLKVHYARRHSRTKRFCCSMCKFGTYFRNRLKAHMLTHSKDVETNPKEGINPSKDWNCCSEKSLGLYKCSECNFETDFKGNLKRHSITHSNSKLHQCSNCGFETNYNFVLKRHKDACTMNNSEEGSLSLASDRVTCSGRGSECDNETQDEMELRTHEIINDRRHEASNNHLKDFPSTSRRSSLTRVNEVCLENDRNNKCDSDEFECSEDKFEYCYESKFKMDADCGFDSRQSKCHGHDFGTNEESDLQLHLRELAISRESQNSEDVNLENSQVTNEEGFAIGTSMSRKTDGNFNRQEHEENGQRDLQLEIGQADLQLQLFELTVHVMGNTFQCTICSYKTTHKSHAKRHSLTHSDAKMFRCPMCEYETNSKASYNRHVDTHGIKESSHTNCVSPRKGNQVTSKFKCAQSSYYIDQQRRLKEPKFIIETTDDKSEQEQCMKSCSGIPNGILFTCSKCDFQTIYKPNLKVHYARRHSGIKQYNRSVYNSGTYYKNNLKSYMLNHKPKDREDDEVSSAQSFSVKSSSCSDSGSRTGYNSDLKESSSPKRHRCPVCNFGTYFKSHLKTHVATHTRDRKTRSNMSAGLYRCSECIFETRLKRELKRHLGTHFPGKLLQCFDCGFENVSSHLYEAHVNSHLPTASSANVFQCSECSFETHIKGNLKRHSITHSNSKLYKCCNCSFETNYKFVLKKHKSCCTVTNPSTNRETESNNNNLGATKPVDKKPFKCPECSFESVYSSNVKVHYTAKHSKVNRFSCSKCSFRTYFRSRLKKHVRTHSKDGTSCPALLTELIDLSNFVSDTDKPLMLFKCSECSFETHLKGNLTRHSRTHMDSKLFQCSKCNFETNYKHVLERHESRHASATLFTCSKCDFVTIFESTLRTHSLTHDGEGNEEAIAHETGGEVEEFTVYENIGQVNDIIPHEEIKRECEDEDSVFEDIKPVHEVTLENIQAGDVTFEHGGQYHELTALEDIGQNGTISTAKCEQNYFTVTEGINATSENDGHIKYLIPEYIEQNFDAFKTYLVTHSEVRNLESADINYEAEGKNLLGDYVLTLQGRADHLVHGSRPLIYVVTRENIEQNQDERDRVLDNCDQGLFPENIEHSYELSFNKF